MATEEKRRNTEIRLPLRFNLFYSKFHRDVRSGYNYKWATESVHGKWVKEKADINSDFFFSFVSFTIT